MRLADDRINWPCYPKPGQNRIIRLAFDDAMRQTTAHDFVSGLLPALGVRAIYAGEDFGFGKQRSGSMDMMREEGRQYGIDAPTVELETMDDDVISSSRIRAAIARADMTEAAKRSGPSLSDKWCCIPWGKTRTKHWLSNG